MSLSTWSYPFYDENTIGKRATSRKKINQNVKKMDTDDDDLADYKPVAIAPEVPKQNPALLKAQVHEDTHYMMQQAMVPPEMNTASSETSTLSDRINYMIQMMEQQKDEKTGRVTEEIILYVFLGIFVIFVLDSFVKTGKYSR
jgi:hypothetical protein